MAPPPWAPRRPGVGFIVGMVLSSLAGLVALGFVLVDSVVSTGGVGPLVLGLGLAVLPVPLLVGGVLALDRLEPEPIPELAFAFLWGAGAAALLAAIANTIGFELFALPLLGSDLGFYATATFIAPFTEELLKGAVLVGFLLFRRHHVDSVTDGIIYAAMVALGFAMTENITYYVQAFADGGGGGLAAVFVIRGVFSPLAHPLFTAMTGIGVAYAASRRGGWWAPFVGLGAAMALHATWNGLSGLGLLGDPAAGLLGLLLAYGVLFVVLVALMVVLVWDRRRLVGLIRSYLPAYVGTGVVTRADVEMLSSLRARRRARRLVRHRLGSHGMRAVADYQHAATDLVVLHRRVNAGLTPSGEAEPERAWLLERMQDARARFMPAMVATSPHGAISPPRGDDPVAPSGAGRPASS